MRQARHHLDALVAIHRLPDDGARLSAWRQGMAALGAEAADKRPVPLEGVNPRWLQETIAIALAQGWIDDLGWLSSAHAAAALYEVASALPGGEERRQLGRRVLRHLHEGDARTFIAIAERLARGTRRGLSGAAIRARVALCLDLPIGSGTGADGLALALIYRPDLQREWLDKPSTGSLPSRRLAARLLERAAREAMRRGTQSISSVVSLFEEPAVQIAWQRLLTDREPLVWRYVASARGLLSRLVPKLGQEIARDLDPALTPTEWRRAAASLAATLSLEPDATIARCRELLDSDVARRDPGIASAMILGLSRAAEAEPEAADLLLVDLMRVGGLDAVEALALLRQERIAVIGERAAEVARSRLRRAEFSQQPDDGRAALVQALDAEIQPADAGGQAWLRRDLDGALTAFVQRGARAAHTRALALLDATEELLHRLETSDPRSRDGRQQAFWALREIDQSLLETSSLAELLMLQAKGDAQVPAPLDDCFERLTEWLSLRESDPVLPGQRVEHFTLRLHRVRAMLHLVDGDGSVASVSSGSESDRGTGADPDRRLRMARLLLQRVAQDAPSALRRVVAASAARACDALMREDLGELSDVLVLVADTVHDPIDLSTMSEASMAPEMVRALEGYVRLVKAADEAREDPTQQPAAVDALRRLIASLPAVGTPRVEALRGALETYASSMAGLLSVATLSGVAGDGTARGSALLPLAAAAGDLAQLTAGARRRLGDWPGEEPPVCVTAIRHVDASVEHVILGDRAPLRDALASASASLRDELPEHLARLAELTLSRLQELPAEQPEETPFALSRPRQPAELPLPAWMPPSRTLGGFYVLRPLGAGAVGSVYVACRSEERGRKRAPRFALKVPEYGGDVSHTLSETEFLQLFRNEAGALLSVPQHPNLARLVTFDAGAKPKPILVMELVEGPTLQRLIETRVLDCQRAKRVIDGVAAGLEAMHAAGVGHLDVKPSNIILRTPEEPAPPSVDLHPSGLMQRISRVSERPATEVEPVLVDFGLAGRNIRPGCATASYGAPEVWGHVPEGHDPRPAAADVYAFACLVFESLTGRELFPGPTHMAVISSHFTHDGAPPRLADLRGAPGVEQFAQVLRMALRQDPRNRCSITEMRRALEAFDLSQFPWPLS